MCLPTLCAYILGTCAYADNALMRDVLTPKIGNQSCFFYFYFPYMLPTCLCTTPCRFDFFCLLPKLYFPIV